VSDILQLARAGGAKLNLELIELKLAEAIEAAYEAFRLQFIEKTIVVDMDAVASYVSVYADPDKFSQILHNLFQNALQYTPIDGHVKIASDTIGKMTRITFANTYQGPVEDDVTLFFERFYRGEKSRSRSFGGAGIGLSVVQELVTAHGGQSGAFYVENRFHLWFTLPNKPVV
jgi:signal transduction histidine kinase